MADHGSISVVFEYISVHIRRDCVVMRLADCPSFPWRPRICAWALRDSILLVLWSVARNDVAASAQLPRCESMNLPTR